MPDKNKLTIKNNKNRKDNMGKTMIKDAKQYSSWVPAALRPVCETLRKEISKIMPKGTARIYYSMPAWLINDNPIVAYKASSKHVLLLFWSGKSFKTPGLVPGKGSFKAGETKYSKAADIDKTQLRKWLRESIETQWNYRDIRKNNGKLAGLTIDN